MASPALVIVALLSGAAWISVALLYVGPGAPFPTSYPWWYEPAGAVAATSVLLASLSPPLVALAVLAFESPPPRPIARYSTLAAAALPAVGSVWLAFQGKAGSDQPALTDGLTLAFGGAGLYLLIGNLAAFGSLPSSTRWVGAASGAMLLLAAATEVATVAAAITLAALAFGFVLYMVWSVMVAMHMGRTRSVQVDRVAAQ